MAHRPRRESLAEAMVALDTVPTAPVRSHPTRYDGSVRHYVVSTYPPARDGIARYADQWVADARNGTREVVRLGLAQGVGHLSAEGGGDLKLHLCGWVRPLRLLRATRRGDSLLLMWHPSLFLTGGTLPCVMTYLSLGFVARRRRTTVIIHEHDPKPEQLPVRHAVLRDIRRISQAWFWRGPARVCLHTERQRRAFEAEFRDVRTDVIAHEAAMVPAVREDKLAARKRLGIDEEAHVLLCIGFIGQHKGFHRAMEAFRSIPAGTARLYVVGSLLDPEAPGGSEYAASLRHLAAGVPGIEFHERYLADDEFDLWLQAADTLILPYLANASSGVLARASLFGLRALVANVGNLEEQVRPGDEVFSDEAELAALLTTVVAGARSRS